MRHRHHQQLRSEPGRGTEVPGVGADSRRPFRHVRRAARRPESRSPDAPGPADRSAARSPLAIPRPAVYRDRPRASGWRGSGEALPVGDGMRHAGTLSVSKPRVSLASGPAYTPCGPASSDHLVSRHPIGAETERARSRYTDRRSLVRRGRPPRCRGCCGRLVIRVGRFVHGSHAPIIIGGGERGVYAVEVELE